MKLATLNTMMHQTFPYKFLTALMVVLLLTGCPDEGAWVEAKGQRFYVAIADDDASRARGLMFVDELPKNEGMFFVFRREEPRAFWMKNTRIPLDIIYLNQDLVVVDIIEQAKPCRSARCPSYPSARPAQYVLELNGGMAQEIGLGVGDLVVVGNLTLPHQRP